MFDMPQKDVLNLSFKYAALSHITKATVSEQYQH